jgi:hypothetical protein
VTPFEATVLLICATLAMTNFVGLAHHPHLAKMPGWYAFILAALAVAIAACLVTTIIMGALS